MFSPFFSNVAPLAAFLFLHLSPQCSLASPPCTDPPRMPHHPISLPHFMTRLLRRIDTCFLHSPLNPPSLATQVHPYLAWHCQSPCYQTQDHFSAAFSTVAHSFFLRYSPLLASSESCLPDYLPWTSLLGPSPPPSRDIRGPQAYFLAPPLSSSSPWV